MEASTSYQNSSEKIGRARPKSSYVSHGLCQQCTFPDHPHHYHQSTYHFLHKGGYMSEPPSISINSRLRRSITRLITSTTKKVIKECSGGAESAPLCRIKKEIREAQRQLALINKRLEDKDAYINLLRRELASARNNVKPKSIGASYKKKCTVNKGTSNEVRPMAEAKIQSYSSYRREIYGPSATFEDSYGVEEEPIRIEVGPKLVRPNVLKGLSTAVPLTRNLISQRRRVIKMKSPDLLTYSELMEMNNLCSIIKRGTSMDIAAEKAVQDKRTLAKAELHTGVESSATSRPPAPSIKQIKMEPGKRRSPNTINKGSIWTANFVADLPLPEKEMDKNEMMKFILHHLARFTNTLGVHERRFYLNDLIRDFKGVSPKTNEECLSFLNKYLRAFILVKGNVSS